MPRSRRQVKERDPKVFRFAYSLFGPIWSLALIWYFSLNAGPLFFPSGSHGKPVDQTPLVVGFMATILLGAAALAVLKIQNAAGKTLRELQDLSPDAFEDWVAARFREMGFLVKTAGSQGDHGADLVIRKNGEHAIVQCKKYNAWSVGEPVLRDLFGAMHDFGVDHAYLVTTGRVTDAGRQWAKGKPITIWDGEYVARLSKQMEKRTPPAPPPADQTESLPQTEAPSAAPPAQTTPTVETTQANFSTPACPKCGAKLVVRHNRSNGEAFLACPGFPNCRYTRPLAKST